MGKKSIIILCFLWSNAFSQDYNTGIGFRLGGLTSGITIKHFVNPTSALEGVLSFGHRSFVITGLYEKHYPITNAENLKWFFGGGAHLGFFRYGGSYYIYKNRGNRVYVEDAGTSSTIGGLDFILGLDYKIKNAPLDISADIKPFVDFFEFPSGYFDGGVSLRFTF
jgi:hypothetical protein